MVYREEGVEATKGGSMNPISKNRISQAYIEGEEENRDRAMAWVETKN